MSRCFLNTLQRYYFEQAKARKKCIVMLVESVERAFKTSPNPFQGGGVPNRSKLDTASPPSPLRMERGVNGVVCIRSGV